MDGWKEIALHYLRGWFTVDFATSVPITFVLSLAEYGGGSSNSVMRMPRLLRMLKALKVLKEP